MNIWLIESRKPNKIWGDYISAVVIADSSEQARAMIPCEYAHNWCAVTEVEVTFVGKMTSAFFKNNTVICAKN